MLQSWALYCHYLTKAFFLIFFCAFAATFLFTIPHNMFIHNQFFSQPLEHSLSNLITAPSLVCMRGMFFHLGGDQNFFTRPGGGSRFFPHRQRGQPIFFTYAKGVGPEKIGDRPSQTDGPPPDKKSLSIIPGLNRHPCPGHN